MTLTMLTTTQVCRDTGLSYRRIDTPCWEYDGYRNEKGYGRSQRRQLRGYVHRLVWEAIFGPIPEDLCVLHRCDNPPCYRPDHLFLGTRQDNSADMVRKGRKKGKGGQQPREICRRGHRITERNGRRRCYICKAAGDAAYYRARHPDAGAWRPRHR